MKVFRLNCIRYDYDRIDAALIAANDISEAWDKFYARLDKWDKKDEHYNRQNWMLQEVNIDKDFYFESVLHG